MSFELTTFKETSSPISQTTTNMRTNCIIKEAINSGRVSHSSSSTFIDDSANDDEDDSPASCSSSSGKDSGIGNGIMSVSCDASNRSRNTSESNNLENATTTTGSSVRENNINTTTSGGGSLSSSSVSHQVDLDSTFLWDASLLYFTGIPGPRVKEHHFIASSLPPAVSSSSAATFSLFKSRSNSGKLSRSTLSLRSSEDPGGMEDHTSRSPWRFGGNRKKFNTPTIKTSSPMALESSTVTMQTPDSGFVSGSGGESCDGGSLASSTYSFRRRHASYRNSSTPTSSVSTGSLRLMDNVTTKSTNHSPSTSGGSFLRFASAKKALRKSFNAAKSLFPGSSSAKIVPVADAARKTSLKSKGNGGSKRDDFSLFPSPFNDNEISAASSSTLSAQNSSAPNTPAVAIKKSRLERARKRFVSTLSLHTSSSSGGGNPAPRSKSASTLALSESEAAIPGASIPTGVIPYHYAQPELNTSFTSKESYDVLAVIEKDHSNFTASNNTKQVGPVSVLATSSSDSKSPFRLIGRSKFNKENKSDTHPQGFDVQQPGAPRQRQEKGKAVKEKQRSSSSPKAGGIQLFEKNTQQRKLVEEITETRRKRMSLVKSFVGFGGNGAVASKKRDDDDASGKAGGNERVIFYETFGGTMSESEKRTKRHEDGLEIIPFDKEPRRVRTPETGRRRQRLSSGEGGSTAPFTPPSILSSTTSEEGHHHHHREIHELEVSETSIDIISPVKSPQQLFRHNDDDDGTAKRDDNDVDCDPGAAVIREISQRESTQLSSTLNNPSRSSSSEKSCEKKAVKSQSLIANLVSLSPPSSSSTFSAGRNMPDSKKKRKNLRKSHKKDNVEEISCEATATTELENQQTLLDQSSSSSSFERMKGLDICQDETASAAAAVVASESCPQSNSIESESKVTLEVPPAARRRKSSEDFKELRKNGVYSNGSAFGGEGVIVDDTMPVQSRQDESSSSIMEKDAGDEEKRSVATVVEDVADNIRRDSYYAYDTETDPETACTESFRKLKPFHYDLEPVEEGKKERLYKVLVVGELGAGKTSIIKRYVHQFFSQHYRATIGVDFALKVLRWDPDTVVRLQLWDIAGQERFGSMTRVYYKEAVGAFVVFDVTRSATLEAVPKWKADLDAKVALPDGRPIPTVLLANKSDQPKEGIAANREKMNDFCQQQGFSAWFETSAKDNINIDESANFLVSKILEMDKWSQEPLAADPDKVELTANGKHKGSSSSNCAC